MGNREYHYLPWENWLNVAKGAGDKVGADGRLLPFYGNTVIYDLTDEAKDALKQLQDRLYESCGHFLSEKLTRESFHMTLHDLLSGTDREEVLSKVNELSGEAKQAVEKAKQLASRLADAGIPAEILPTEGRVGGGSVPNHSLPSYAVAFDRDVNRLEQTLRKGLHPIIGRIHEGKYLLDVRTLFEADFPVIVEALKEAML